MSIQLVQSLLAEFHDKLSSLAGSINRETVLPSVPNKIMVTIGMRRTGKTYYMLQHIETLIKSGVPLQRIL